MSSLFVNACAFIVGALAGSLSGQSLIHQIGIQTSKPSRYVALFPVIRIGSLALMSWYLLRWGPVPFILFGVSMLVAMWIVIITFSD